MAAAAITLRLAGPHDVRTLALMSRDLIEAGLGWHYQPGRIMRLVKDPDTIAVVASDRGRTAGFAIMEFGEERAHLVLLAVMPEHQRQGVGRNIMEWLIESAETAGIASLHLELRASNQGARAFYRALGFVETLYVPGYYGQREPAVRMLRVLRIAGPAGIAWRPPRLGKPAA